MGRVGSLCTALDRARPRSSACLCAARCVDASGFCYKRCLPLLPHTTTPTLLTTHGFLLLGTLWLPLLVTMSETITCVVLRRSGRLAKPGCPVEVAAVPPKRARTVLKSSPSAVVSAIGGPHVPAPLAPTPVLAALHPFSHPTPRRTLARCTCKPWCVLYGFWLLLFPTEWHWLFPVVMHAYAQSVW